MSERLSSFERVVGDISDADKEKALERMSERFDDQSFEELRGEEREKTPEELEIISLANEATNGILRKYGLEDFDIPQQNIHIITRDAWMESGETGLALYDSKSQAVAVKESSSNIVFLKLTIHELLHFKSYNSLQTMGKDGDLEEYRVGLVVRSRSGGIDRFENLNEAITEEITRRLLVVAQDNDLFEKDAEQTEEIMGRLMADYGDLPQYDDVYYASYFEEDGETFGKTENLAYPDERKMFNIIIDKLWERNPGLFKDREDVFEVFSKGMMTGNLLEVGRLVDQTFGKGTLRKIGELDQDIEEQIRFVESL